jgi:hypothetical protein
MSWLPVGYGRKPRNQQNLYANPISTPAAVKIEKRVGYIIRRARST